MITYVVDDRNFRDRHEATEHAKGLSKSRDSHVSVVVENQIDAWVYGGPACLERFRTVEHTAPCEIDRIKFFYVPRTLD